MNLTVVIIGAVCGLRWLAPVIKGFVEDRRGRAKRGRTDVCGEGWTV
jgi:hypothetical protein